MACKCYHAERNFIGKIGVCWGTKECEACSCGGDESKCDFYEDKRKKAVPKITNADRLRALSDEELAEFFANKQIKVEDEIAEKWGFSDHISTKPTVSEWLDWLRQEATT